MKNKKSLLRNKKKKGFTLVELMAVIAIMLILSVAFLPKFSGYIKESKKMKVLNQAKLVATAYETAKLSNSSLVTSTTVKDFEKSTELIDENDIKNLSSITIADCLNILNTEDYKFSIGDDGTIATITPQS